MKEYYIYILASLSRRLYVGVTNNLDKRMFEHRQGVGSSFTKKYNVKQLVWYEETNDILAAIEYEKKIKSWRREKKITLIEETNAGWIDLADGWFEEWTCGKDIVSCRFRPAVAGRNDRLVISRSVRQEIYDW